MTEMVQHVRTTIKYDGPALTGHEMDVRDLAPALLALADIIQVANTKFNGNSAEIRVLVNADVEQKCFMIDISLVQSILSQAKTFFDQDAVKTAKEIAEWIGIIGSTSVGLFGLLKFMRQPKEGGIEYQVKQDTGATTITIIGNGNNVTVPIQTYQLAQEKLIVDRVKEVMKPLKNAGYESLSFVQSDVEIFEVSAQEASEIIATPSDGVTPLQSESVSQIRGIVRIKSPQYEGNAKWSLLWNGRAIDAEMVDSALDWVKDFQENKVSAPPNSQLDVSMTETAKLDDKGMIIGKATYVVQQIHGVTPPPHQMNLV